MHMKFGRNSIRHIIRVWQVQHNTGILVDILVTIPGLKAKK